MSDITVKASRWTLGWELSVEGVGVTQVRTLARAEQQVRDYLDTIDPSMDHDGWMIRVVPDLGSVIDEVRGAQAASEAAAVAQAEAGRRMRAVVRRLRVLGLSLADTACILGVSKGRISQLT